ncbi:MAG: dihydropteroate synthase [Candidatus Aenigmarchaeota archaeon]|nr:dihydropteroate synthase [Candidatus Aenigmarchaeota archaeon]
MELLNRRKGVLVMGILNTTPDSFYAGGRYASTDAAVAHGQLLAEDGADIIDIGGESSRPGSAPVGVEEEIRRTLPVIKRLSTTNTSLSIDTCRPEVAEAGVVAGAAMINDITGLANPKMLEIAARYHVPAVIMHMQGSPRTMQDNPTYSDVVGEVKEFLSQRAKAASQHGVRQVVLDPGIGFGKNLQHNLQLLKNLGQIKSLGYPVLVGPSRKSFIGAITGQPAGQRLEGTIAACILAAANGADILRVHDVKAVKSALAVADAIISA